MSFDIHYPKLRLFLSSFDLKGALGYIRNNPLGAMPDEEWEAFYEILKDTFDDQPITIRKTIYWHFNQGRSIYPSGFYGEHPFRDIEPTTFWELEEEDKLNFYRNFLNGILDFSVPNGMVYKSCFSFNNFKAPSIIGLACKSYEAGSDIIGFLYDEEFLKRTLNICRGIDSPITSKHHVIIRKVAEDHYFTQSLNIFSESRRLF